MRNCGRHLGRHVPSLPLQELEEFLGDLARRTAEVEDALSLGSLASEYAWFRRRFPRVFMQSEVLLSSRVYGSPAGLPMTREDLLRGLAFAMNATIQWQRFPPAPHPEAEPSHDKAADASR